MTQRKEYNDYDSYCIVCINCYTGLVSPEKHFYCKSTALFFLSVHSRQTRKFTDLKNPRNVDVCRQASTDQTQILTFSVRVKKPGIGI